jgi:hypothetical protein
LQGAETIRLPTEPNKKRGNKVTQIYLGNYSLVKHNDPGREAFGGITCGKCDSEVSFGSKVYNEDESNNYLCLVCYREIKYTPKLLTIRKCAGIAKTRLFQLKKEVINAYYKEECAKYGVIIKGVGGNRFSKKPTGEPTGGERKLITMRAKSTAQNRVRKEYYDLYQEFYSDELNKAGIKPRTYGVGINNANKIKSLEAEIIRLQALLQEKQKLDF